MIDPFAKLDENVTVSDVMESIMACMPDVEKRFKRLHHRQIRVSLFVESMDPLAQPITDDSPVCMIPLYTKDIPHG